MSRPATQQTTELCQYILNKYPKKEYDASEVAKWVSIRSNFTYAHAYRVVDTGILEKFLKQPVKVRTSKGKTLGEIQASKEEAFNDYTRIKKEMAAKEKKKNRAALGVVKSRKDYEKGKFITLRTDEEIDAHYYKLAEQESKTQPSKYGIIAALVLSCVVLAVIFSILI